MILRSPVVTLAALLAPAVALVSAPRGGSLVRTLLDTVTPAAPASPVVLPWSALVAGSLLLLSLVRTTARIARPGPAIAARHRT